jgi:transcriptional regulator with PAS, ATPase and Fis domain
VSERDDPETTRGASLVSTVHGTGAWVLVTVGPATGSGELRAYPLPATGSVTIGREADCDFVLDHHRVSRRHARVRVGPEGDTCTIEDLGSRNGTKVGVTIPANQPHVVRPGDAISIGPFTLVAVRETAAPQPSSSLVIDDPLGTSPSPVLSSVARSATSVLIRGESGAGKQVLAETLHRLSGRPGKLVSINCAAIGNDLLESELFGHERGAFTGAVAMKPGLLEVAGGGTVLLDEIGDMPPSLQAKLLRAVESREVQRVGGTEPISIAARFVSATHRDLMGAVEVGDFRLDLYYRLAGVTLTIPPLRERAGAIAQLAKSLLSAAATRDKRKVPSLSPSALAKLQTHEWPGNVRELRNVMDRALVLSSGDDVIQPGHIAFDEAPQTVPLRALKPAPNTASPVASAPAPSAGGDLSAAEVEERAKIVAALEQCSGNQTRAAKVLGISRSTLATKLSIYRIPRPRK